MRNMNCYKYFKQVIRQKKKENGMQSDTLENTKHYKYTMTERYNNSTTNKHSHSKMRFWPGTVSSMTVT